MATATPTTSGYYALSVPAGLTVGTHNLKVTYSGDSNYSGSQFDVGDGDGAASDLVTASYRRRRWSANRTR